MARDNDPDAGMRAVARVRGVREQDSRLGVARAAADERESARRLDAVVARLASAAEPSVADPEAYTAARRAAAGLAADVTASRAALASAATLTTLAREHWQRDRTRLSAVELLLEHRAQQRRAERLRRERVEVDDLVAARWMRARPTEPSADPLTDPLTDPSAGGAA
ncbi:flagellar FliJ family protein [Nocardioides sp. zg-1228]|uniref:flagellar FliJ family protein n=1 Tax=Nocardioides sp. zg-1228 TaxID=2763008 RepID=UPI0016433A00|nr:flagellar FliJ family protein [Nocardioides sp. zg-1228]MBC2932328.1 flagellar FliJ family protein [Nocardioides sp. zg-1228]QSF57844.1 flagellar FliJ family protein [Nocardioides sp. zg-1228]